MRDRFVVVWRVTERCNLGCAFCAYDRRLPFERRHASADRILRFARVLAEFQARSNLHVHVSFLGGEPVLWPPLPDVEGALTELGLSLGITTNGTTLGDPRTRERLLSCYDELTLSVDARGSLHDSLRAWPGGFARLHASVRALLAERSTRKGRLRVRVNSVLMRQTIGLFPALCRELGRWGIDEITFNQLGGNDRPQFFARHHLRPDQVRAFAAVVPELRRELAARGVVLRGAQEYLARIEQTALGRRLPILDCAPGDRFLFVDESGIVSPCSFTPMHYGVPIDELRRPEDILELHPRFAAVMRSRRAPVCNDCPSTRVFSKFADPEVDHVEERRYGT